MPLLLLLLMVAQPATAQRELPLFTVDYNGVSLRYVLQDIRNKTGLRFTFTKELLETAQLVTLHCMHVTEDSLLQAVFEEQPRLVYKRRGRTIDVRAGKRPEKITQRIHTGITDNTVSDTAAAPEGRTSNLDEVMKTGYGNTSQRLATGSMTKLIPQKITVAPPRTMADVTRLPVAGVQYQPLTGVPYGGVEISIRGDRRLYPLQARPNNNTPLIVVDNVPFDSHRMLVSITGDPAGAGPGYNPLAGLQADNIESVMFLKDAVSTAPYGARGANGVILITTKRGNSSKAFRIQANYAHGWMTAIRLTRMMDVDQFRRMRRLGYKNDGRSYTRLAAPDLYLKDSLEGIDWQERVLRNTGQTENAGIQLSKMFGRLQWNASGQYMRTGYTVATTRDEHLSAFTSLQYKSPKGNWLAHGMLWYTNSRNQGPSVNMFMLQYLNPLIRDSLKTDPLTNARYPGWKQEDVFFASPAGWLSNRNTTTVNNAIGNVFIRYSPVKDLSVSVKGGWNDQVVREQVTRPMTGSSPQTKQYGRQEFGYTHSSNMIVEPQVDYSTRMGEQLTARFSLGGSYQYQRTNLMHATRDSLTSQEAVDSAAVFPPKKEANDNIYYKYLGLLGHINLNYNNQLIADLLLRRDASSRLAPEQRWGTFYAGGIAWIFTESPFMEHAKPVVNYGKLRASYGITGSDRLTDHAYAGSYQQTDASHSYGEQPALVNTKLYNSWLRWPVTRKFEVALEWQFINRTDLRVCYYSYKNRDEYIEAPGGVTINYEAKIRNSGVEVYASHVQPLSRQSSVTLTAMATFPRTILAELPRSSIAPYNKLMEGHPLSARRVLESTGRLKDTAFTFVDHNKDGVITYEKDAQEIVNRDVRCYASFELLARLGNWQIQAAFDYRAQTLYSARYYYLNRMLPGNISRTQQLSNQPASMMAEPWLFTTKQLSEKKDVANLLNSDAILDNGSYCLLRLLGVAWDMPGKWLKRTQVNGGTFYMQADNVLFLYCPYKDGNPMLQTPVGYPAVRQINMGVRLSF